MSLGSTLIQLILICFGLKKGWDLYKESKSKKILKKSGNIGAFFLNTDEGWEYSHRTKDKPI